MAGFQRPGLGAGLAALEGRCLPGEGPWDRDPCAPVNSEQVGACWGLLALPAPEMRVRPLQVEKSGSGLCRPDCKMLQAPEFLELLQGPGTAVLGRGEVALP